MLLPFAVLGGAASPRYLGWCCFPSLFGVVLLSPPLHFEWCCFLPPPYLGCCCFLPRFFFCRPPPPVGDAAFFSSVVCGAAFSPPPWGGVAGPPITLEMKFYNETKLNKDKFAHIGLTNRPMKAWLPLPFFFGVVLLFPIPLLGGAASFLGVMLLSLLGRC